MRGATQVLFATSAVLMISIHTPHAGSDLGGESIGQTPQISIHTPHAGSDRL